MRSISRTPADLLTPERARTLLPALKAAIGPRPLELHSHCNIGLAPFSYLAGVDAGVEPAACRGSAARQRHLAAGG